MPDWFPDWRGETCVIVAGGPSAKDADLELCRGRARVIAINTSWQLVPWADVIYAADGAWWNTYEAALRDFAGLKVTVDRKVSKRLGIHLIELTPGSYKLTIERPGFIGVGGNSGFQAVNLAAQFGVARIVLVGFDLTLAHGVHWHGPHPRGLANPHEGSMERWRRVLDEAAPVLAGLGIETINTSEVSALREFPKMSLAEALAQGESR